MNLKDKKDTKKTTSCVHHWILESPNGPTSEGVCRVCGKTKTFPNTLQGIDWKKPSVGRPREIVL